MGKKISVSLTTFLAVLLMPVVFACAHAPVTDGLVDVDAEGEENPGLALVEPTAIAAFSSAEVSQEKIQEAQKSVVKDKKKHKKISHPFSAPVAAKKRKPKAAPVVALAPVVRQPEALVQRNGSTLNRYYFLRAGDTPEIVSKLVYGKTDRAAELVDWNGAAVNWEPGKVVYYRSGKNPDDTKLLSFYSEAGIVTEEITVASGDTLRSIAESRYGSPNSWREIAVLNGIKGESEPSTGTALKVYPFPLVKQPEMVLAQSTPPAVAEQIKAAETKETKMASAQIASFIQHNPLIVACSVVALILLMGYLYMQRRRYRSRFDF